MLMSLCDMSLSNTLFLFPLSRVVLCGATINRNKQVDMRAEISMFHSTKRGEAMMMCARTGQFVCW